mgnify:FL=1
MIKNLDEISDGKRYGLNDMVRAACNDCAGCSSCCEDMGDSIILDPFDIYELTANLGCSFEDLLKKEIGLTVADGMILPNLKMTEENVCPFLNQEKRCSIHGFRPGICRVFPLGRIYEDDHLDYFLQLDGCVKENRSKVKVSKWLDTQELKKNQKYLIDWHAFRKKIEGILLEMEDENQKKTISMFLLNTFFVNPYDGKMDFYEQFYERMDRISCVLK